MCSNYNNSINMIRLQNISKHYKRKIAVDDISFTLKKGDYTGLVGNNGSGKTTIINMLCNLISTTKGDIYVFDKLVSPKYVEYKRNFGILLDQPYYIEEFTIKEYLEFVVKFQKPTMKNIQKRILELCAFLSINDINEQIRNLSSGNKMKVSIISSLIHNPEVLIYDEPFVNLDISTIQKIKDILFSFKSKKTLLITSHNLDLMIEVCDRIIIIDNGKILLDLNVKDYDSKEVLKKEIKESLGKDETINVNWF